MAEVRNSKDFWDKIKILGTVVTTVGLPLIIAVVGYGVNLALKEKEVRTRMVELAIGILAEEPVEEVPTSELREWAISVIDEFSGVALSSGARGELLKSALPAAGLEPGEKWTVQGSLSTSGGPAEIVLAPAGGALMTLTNDQGDFAIERVPRGPYWAIVRDLDTKAASRILMEVPGSGDARLGEQLMEYSSRREGGGS